MARLPAVRSANLSAPSRAEERCGVPGGAGARQASMGALKGDLNVTESHSVAATAPSNEAAASPWMRATLRFLLGPTRNLLITFPRWVFARGADNVRLQYHRLDQLSGRDDEEWS